MKIIPSIRAMVVPMCLTGFLFALDVATRAGDAASGGSKANAAATGSNSEVPANALSYASQPATNLVQAPPITGVAAAATNQPQTAATNSSPALDDKHKLAIGDRLSFRIVEDQDDPKPLMVTDSGDVEVPYIGRVPAEGKTCRQLAEEIKTALEKVENQLYFHATVLLAVDLMNKTHGRVYVVGAVRLPGEVELPSDEVPTLSKAILRAGNFTEFANRSHVTVTRKDDTAKGGKKTFTVNVGDIFDKGRIENDMPLEPGDLIDVPDRLIRL